MKPIFQPKSIAVIGGGNDVHKPGGRLVFNLKKGGFDRLWVVNPKGEGVQGLLTVSRISELPETPDLAILSIPAPHVLASVRELLIRGTKGFVVVSCGFSEAGREGRTLEKELVQVVSEAGGYLIGPNSLGVLRPGYFGVFGGPSFEPKAGSVDFVSASGSTAAFIMESALDRGLSFASLFSVGNSAQCGVEEILAYQDETYQSEPVRAKLLYLESIKDPKRLAHHAKSLVRKGCHLVALKAGTTEVGARAASSHTGAIASRDAAVSALFDKAGIIRVQSKSEMVEVAGVLSSGGAPKGRRIGIITHAGGPGILLADELARQGFEVPELLPETQERLTEVMSPGSSPHNPIDFLASGTAEHLRAIFETVASFEAGRLDALCVIFGSPGLFDIWPVLQVILEAQRTLSIPVYPVLPSVRTAAPEAEKFRQAGGFYFTDEVPLAKALGQIARTPAISDEPARLPSMDESTIARVLQEAKEQGITQLGAEQVGTILRAAGFCMPQTHTVKSAEQAVQVCEGLGYPVVLKVLGPVHKSDVNGVLLGVQDAAQVRRGFAKLMAIAGARAVMVQQKVSGLELLLGASKEGEFGHLVVFGLGGIFTEVLGDVAMALAPLSQSEAQRLMTSIKGAPLLQGARGQSGVEASALTECICRMGALVHRFPQIKELDINPLMATGRQLWAVDGRISLERA